jgi:hypothetical protein
MKIHTVLAAAICLCYSALPAQSGKTTVPLTGNDKLMPLNVEMSETSYKGKEAIRVLDTGSVNVQLVKVNHPPFRNGTIEVDLAGQPHAQAGEQARGFVGIAFRVDSTSFECIYLRPTNARADDQLRRNHSVQYTSHPDHPWYKLRKESPGKYESYVDLVPGEWTHVRIDIGGETARLYVHGNAQPTLVVNDLKLGPDATGDIGLWIGQGTEAYFANLVVETQD